MTEALARQDHRVSLLAKVASGYHMEPAAFAATIKATVFPSGRATNEQLAAFLMVADQYGLNPITKEIYAFPTKGGGVMPVVSIDGWLKMANNHPQCDGIVTEDILDGKKLSAVRCKIYRKDRQHPTEVTEYMDECARNTEPWQKWPARMLRHKAVIQCARYAFSFSGIIDPDEADRMGSSDKSAVATVERTNELAAKYQKRVVSMDALDVAEADIIEPETDADSDEFQASGMPLTFGPHGDPA